MVAVLGVDPQKAGRHWRERLGVVLQSSSLYPNLTVRESRIFGGYFAHARDPDEVIGIIGLEREGGSAMQHSRADRNADSTSASR